MKSLYIVDGHSHIFRAYHAVGYLSTSKGVPSHAVLILSTMLWKLIREERPDYLTIAWDAPGGTFRDKLYADYKATRSSMPDDLARQMPYVRRLFEAMRTPVVEVPGYEERATQMMAGRERIRAAMVSPDAAAARIVDTILDDDAPLKSSCDPMGDAMLARWRGSSDIDLLGSVLGQYTGH